MVTDFLAYGKSRDDRTIVLYGLSVGGMLGLPRSPHHVGRYRLPATFAADAVNAG
ncbi:hypothetical protein ACFWVM_04490 [Nocardia fluminea]|uniref:hypothetical protein n=1 Tax=Nocardia fluminea TaxID=134984 RepID=UPI00365F79DD